MRPLSAAGDPLEPPLLLAFPLLPPLLEPPLLVEPPVGVFGVVESSEQAAVVASDMPRTMTEWKSFDVFTPTMKSRLARGR